MANRIKLTEADNLLIVKRTDYFNQYGMHIEHREIFKALPGSEKHVDNFIKFVGHGAIPAVDENGEPDPIPFEFAIAADTIDEAFTKFRVVANLKGAETKQQILDMQKKMKEEAPRIITQ